MQSIAKKKRRRTWPKKKKEYEISVYKTEESLVRQAINKAVSIMLQSMCMLRACRRLSTPFHRHQVFVCHHMTIFQIYEGDV